MEIFFIAAAVTGMTVLFPIKGIVSLLAAVLVLIYCRITAYRDFGGYTGDVCGWFLQLCELAVLAVMVFIK